MNAIEIKNLSFSYKDNRVFDNLNMFISNGSFTTILGKGGVGKSTLYKILSGDFKYQGNILVLGKSLSYALKKNYVGFVSIDYTGFHEKTVMDELLRVLTKKGRSLDKIKADIERVTKKTGIHSILDNKISDLSIKEKILFMFAIQILNKPKVLIIDNVLDYLDIEKEQIIKELKRLNKKNTTINITNNTDQSIYGDEIVIISNDIIKGKTYDILNGSFFEDNDLEFPFIVSLSNKLKFYDLVQENYLDIEKLVDDLWQ